MRLRGAAVAVVIGCGLVLASCTSATPAGSSGTTLTIYAAASLKAVLAKVQAAYRVTNPAASFTISTDSSAALETKIEQGAPGDVFLSADTSNPQKLIDKGLTAGGLTTFARNLLTVVVPAANPAAIGTPVDLARPGLKVIAAADTVPITTYAAQLLTNLAREPGYPADFVAAYESNVVSREDNVAAVVAKIALGEGDAGIVYATDARASTKVATIDVPADANIPATYAGVVLKSSANAVAAQAFLAWLAGPDGQAVVASFGFLPPG